MLLLFCGTYHIRLDEDFRLQLPQKWREEAQAAELREIILLPLEDHLRVEFGEEGEARVLRDVESIQSATTRTKFELIVQARAEQRLDKRGRFVIPERLRRGPPRLGRELIVCGVLRAVEIWPTELWQGDSPKALAVFQRAAKMIGL
jgi:DNA-binding transcriptional regulator/RsmH inhibitor MraZ